jgi:hypothetical protein
VDFNKETNGGNIAVEKVLGVMIPQSHDIVVGLRKFAISRKMEFP